MYISRIKAITSGEKADDSVLSRQDAGLRVEVVECSVMGRDFQSEEAHKTKRARASLGLTFENYYEVLTDHFLNR